MTGCTAFWRVDGAPAKRVSYPRPPQLTLSCARGSPTSQRVRPAQVDPKRKVQATGGLDVSQLRRINAQCSRAEWPRLEPSATATLNPSSCNAVDVLRANAARGRA